MERSIDIRVFLTPQEHMWMGSTPPYEPPKGKDNQRYIPIGISRGWINLKGAIQERKKIGYVKLGYLGHPLGVKGDLVLSLEEIDPKTRKTKRDPRILGVVDPETGEIKPVYDKATGKERDLTKEYINLYRERGLEGDLYLRPQSSKEKESLSGGSEAMREY
ncbi:hypothetical protein HYT32_01800 [Candidatus Roizmanbacteria bacterium]|nr:hypothetical protein [Candidatus Roizmanbacteria bacterium]